MITNLRIFQEVLKRNNLPTPDTYLGISELIRSLYRPDVTPNPERIREVLEELTWPVTVSAGNQITFKSCSEVLASETIVTFAPKQSGTGDPSPSNIRPISGWDSVTINQGIGDDLRSGKISSCGMQATGGLGPSETTDVIYCPCSQGKKYVLLGNDLGTTIVHAFYSSEPVRNMYAYNNTRYNGKVATAPINGWLAYRIKKGTNQNYSIREYYDTHTATFPSTVMGGSYDFATGEGSETWDYIASYAGETLPGEWMSDRDVYAEGTTPTTGAEVAYIAATPTEITLTPADVNLLKGSNTVWTDGDNVTVKFQTLK